MGTSGIISEKNELTISQQLITAAELLVDDYLNDPELTAFCALDGEDFILSVTIK